MVDLTDVQPVPLGSRVLHIGPHKTGTTAVQSAFHRARTQLAGHGVHYAGPNRQPVQAVHAVTGRHSPHAEGRVPPLARWQDLVREVRSARATRVVISSEGLSNADDAAIAMIVRDLDPARIQVIVTLRHLVDILPSQWQQNIQMGQTQSYDEWLADVLRAPDSKAARSFWFHQRHDALIRRWTEAAGADRVTVIVADRRDRDRLPRAFEALLGLPPEFLVPDADLGNRSLTLPEVETMRSLNAVFREEGLGTPLYNKVVRYGAAQYVKRRIPDDDEARIATPGWAIEAGNAVAAAIGEGIRAAGVRVIGDLAAITDPVPIDSHPSAPRTSEPTWAAIGARTALGIVIASGLARDHGAGEAAAGAGHAEARRPHIEPLELARISTPALASALRRRIVARLLAQVGGRGRTASVGSRVD